MNLQLTDLLWVFLLVSIAAQFLRAQQHSAIAQAAARRHCKKQNIQFLDQSVFLDRQALRVGKPFLLNWQKIYCFEFAVTGDRRYRGWVEMSGARVANIELEPHIMPEEGVELPVESTRGVGSCSMR